MRGGCSERLVFTAFTGWQSGFTVISWIHPVTFFRKKKKSKFRVKAKCAKF